MESSPSLKRRPWRKILYEEQDYPDNYVDRTQFLNGLRKNCTLASAFSLTIRFIYPSSVHTDLWPAGGGPCIRGGHPGTEQVRAAPSWSLTSYDIALFVPQCVYLYGSVLVCSGGMVVSSGPLLPLSPAGFSRTGRLNGHVASTRETTPLSVNCSRRLHEAISSVHHFPQCCITYTENTHRVH